MVILVLGMVLFLGTHSVRIFADSWRRQQVARFGELPWKAAYSLASLFGIVLIAWGFGLARQNPVVVYVPPDGLRHLTPLVVLFAFLLVAAAYAPANSLKSIFGNPMILGVKVWAFGHLLSNGRAADLLLFGGFLIWAIVDYASAQRRNRRDGVRAPAATRRGNLAVLVGGVAGCALFAFLLHGWLIGVNPFAAG
jgi:uncharacterized membrane protein